MCLKGVESSREIVPLKPASLAVHGCLGLLLLPAERVALEQAHFKGKSKGGRELHRL